MNLEKKENLEKNIELWEDILKDDQQWDFSFLERIILHKVKLMRQFYLDGHSNLVQESVDRTIDDMTTVIDALERLKEQDYIQIPKDKQPILDFVSTEDKGISQMVFNYHSEFGPEKVDDVYKKAKEDEERDRALVYDTLRDNAPNWWD